MRSRLAAVATPAAKVVICIQTDGQENSSTEHNWAELNALVKQKSAQGWQFNFMGVGIDAYEQGARMGIAPAATVAYDHRSAEATQAVFAASAENAREYRARATPQLGLLREAEARCRRQVRRSLLRQTQERPARDAAVEERDRRRYHSLVGRRSRYASPFGASVSVALAEARMTQTELAAKPGGRRLTSIS